MSELKPMTAAEWQVISSQATPMNMEPYSSRIAIALRQREEAMDCIRELEAAVKWAATVIRPGSDLRNDLDKVANRAAALLKGE